jgi:predicted ATPase/DNA-binding winged helix-turn-helix (wHTH) protein
MDDRAISFGPYRLVPAQRLLLEGENPVRLGSRALEVLTILVERAGDIVGREELIARAWPGIFIEESNLRVQISALRRALGDGQAGQRYIVTVPGRGYNFVAPLGLDQEARAPPPRAATPSRHHNLPLAVTRVIGREESVAALLVRLSRERLVTIVGPGGIGKTTLALAVAERLKDSYEDGVWFIDLATLSDARLVVSAVATALGLEIRIEDQLRGLVSGLGDKRMLLVLDNSEHVIDAAAQMAIAILSGAPGLAMLATSREPLEVDGEHEYRVGPLAGPPASARLTAAEAMAYPTVQLFVERATTALDEFGLSDADAVLVAEICRRLDGLPLAIEFAAARAQVLGVQALATHLDDSLRLLGARRGKRARHRTMSAVLEWSYGLLTAEEQCFFRRLAIFAGSFTIEAATNVALDVPQSPADAIDRLADLVAKSLVAADVGGVEPRFRLLETTRGYALEKLAESGEREPIARRHAGFYRDLFERAESELTERPVAEWLADYGWRADDLRRALDWAFSPDGAASLGVALTAAAVPLWTRLSLMWECRRRVEQALATLASLASPDLRREMQLLVALGASHLLTVGNSTSEAEAAWRRALDISECLGDTDYRLRALWGLYNARLTHGRYRQALAFAEKFHTVAIEHADTAAAAIGERFIGAMLHLLGDQEAARPRLERALAPNTINADPRHPLRFQFDQRVAAHGYLARVLWLQGSADRSLQVVRHGLEAARASDHAVSLFYMLIHAACPIALFAGDFAAADRCVAMMFDLSDRHAVTAWNSWARCYQGVLFTKRGDPTAGSRLLCTSLNELPETVFNLQYTFLTAELASALGDAGEIGEGRAAIARALARSKRNEEGWCLAELLRIKGELLLLKGEPGAAEAEYHFRQSLDFAHRQGALSWELRATASLARLLRNRGQTADAKALLQRVYGRFTEGFGTADLTAARRVLDELDDAADT